MKHRVGKEYNKVKCPLCNSIYLMEDTDMHWVQVKELCETKDKNGNPVLGKDGKPIMNKEIRWKFSFFCDECYQNMWGVRLDRFIATDELIEDYKSQMKPLFQDIDNNGRKK